MRRHFCSVRLFAVCTAVLFYAVPAKAQTLDASFRSDIEKLLEVTNSAQLGTQMAGLVSDQILKGMKQSQPDVPERALVVAREVLATEFAKAFAGPDSLMEQMVSIYAKHFSHDDVRGLLAFYTSELGKKSIATMPVLLQEGAAAGQQWAAKETPRIIGVLQDRLRAEGFMK